MRSTSPSDTVEHKTPPQHPPPLKEPHHLQLTMQSNRWLSKILQSNRWLSRIPHAKNTAMEIV